jgi:hypothetical protein
MPATYEPIATTTLGSAAATITFSSIPSTYTDLRLVLVASSVSGSNFVTITFNGTGGTAYSQTSVYGLGTSAITDQTTSQAYINLAVSGLSTTIPTMYTLDVFSYTGSTFKTSLFNSNEDKNGSGAVTAGVGLWRNTAAINTLGISKPTGNYTIGTTATLYGILKA